MSTLISVDWDFFHYNGTYEPECPIVLNGKPDMMPGMFLYDWGHSEAHSDEIQQIQWSYRFADFRRLGLDIEQEAGLRIDPAEFTREVWERLDGRVRRMSYIADSHAWAGLIVRDHSVRGKRPLHVVSFDAHHDLGYEGVDPESGDLHCADWLYRGLQNRWVQQATVVYPDWRGLGEWNDVDAPIDRPHLEPFKDRIRVMTWSEWLAQPVVGRGQVHTFACRSSAWSPPWLDEEFEAFAERFCGVSLCLDCLHETQIGPYNACLPREWDRAEAVREADQRDEMIAAVYAMRERMEDEQVHATE